MRFHMNITVFFALVLGYLSLIIQYYEYFCGRGQPYMNVFNMISGQITPHSIGLNDENIIKDILKKTRICFKLIDLLRFSVPIVTLVISNSSFLIKGFSLNTICFGLIHSLINSLVAFYMFNGLSSQLFYFYIICYYLKLKQREVNNYLLKVIKNKERIKIYNSNEMIEKLDKIYKEIKECDSHFWSKFLATSWIFCTSTLSLAVFILAFNSENNLFIQIILFYANFVFLSILLSLISMCGSVNSEAKVTYKLLSYKLVCIQTKQSVVSMARHRIKVLKLINKMLVSINIFLCISF